MINTYIRKQYHKNQNITSQIEYEETGISDIPCQRWSKPFLFHMHFFKSVSETVFRRWIFYEWLNNRKTSYVSLSFSDVLFILLQSLESPEGIGSPRGITSIKVVFWKRSSRPWLGDPLRCIAEYFSFCFLLLFFFVCRSIPCYLSRSFFCLSLFIFFVSRSFFSLFVCCSFISLLISRSFSLFVSHSFFFSVYLSHFLFSVCLSLFLFSIFLLLLLFSACLSFFLSICL